MRAQFYVDGTSATIATRRCALGHATVAVVGAQLAGVSIADAGPAEGVRRLARLLDIPLESETARDAIDGSERLALDVLDRIVSYLDGDPVSFDDIPVAVDHLSPFQRRVSAACRAIPRGATRTYGSLAAAAGAPGAARAVGQVMRCNRTPLIVPCHRVVAAGGKLGGFSAPQGLALKRRLLALEGAWLDEISLVELRDRTRSQTRNPIGT